LCIWWSKWALDLIVVTSTLKSAEHSQLLGIVNCTNYGTHQRISYEVQATNYHTKSCSRSTKMLEGNKICDITLELIFNGVLPHKCDAPTITTTPNITCCSSTYKINILIWDFALKKHFTNLYCLILCPLFRML
jgi:hypothetical protein